MRENPLENRERERAQGILFLGGTSSDWQELAFRLKETFKGVDSHCLEDRSLLEFEGLEDCMAVVIDFGLRPRNSWVDLTVLKQRCPALPVLLCVKLEQLQIALNELGHSIDDFVIKTEAFEFSLGRRIEWVRRQFEKLERERAHVNRVFQQTQKLEALGVLAGGLAHKFNNILTAVLGYTEMSIVSLPQGPNRDNLLHVMEAGAKARDLVRQLASLSHLGEGAQRKVIVSAMVKETLKFLKASIPATVQIQEDLRITPPGWDTVFCDPVHLYQMLSNLCINAASSVACSIYGSLAIKLFPLDIQTGDMGAFSHLKSGRYVALQVNASHKGVGGSSRVRTFEFPYSTDGGRLELGLSIVQNLVKEYGGGIEIKRAGNEETVATVLLPAVDVLPARGGVDAGVPMPMGTEHILLVDDEEMVVHVGSKMLDKLGYKVTSFVNSLQALEFFKNHSAEVDLVLTDLTMPDLNGLDLAERIFALRSDIPVIVCTGYTDEVAVDKMKKLGLETLIRKPFIMKLLATTVRDTLDRRQSW